MTQVLVVPGVGGDYTHGGVWLLHVNGNKMRPVGGFHKEACPGMSGGR